MTARIVDVTRAQVSRGADGSVTVDDPYSPWVVRMWGHTDRGRTHITLLQVEVRDLRVGVTAHRLGRLPTSQLQYLAAAHAQPGHPNEGYYRMLATPRVGRVWDDGHWGRVLDVFAWAEETGRPGGGKQAVADLWDVALNPTVYRWLNVARHASREAAA